ncbi:hypothetical protein [Burkholderia plantarii]|nr:hypothetical protein [Burkholderia plantarii]
MKNQERSTGGGFLPGQALPPVAGFAVPGGGIRAARLIECASPVIAALR